MRRRGIERRGASAPASSSSPTAPQRPRQLPGSRAGERRVDAEAFGERRGDADVLARASVAAARGAKSPVERARDAVGGDPARARSSRRRHRARAAGRVRPPAQARALRRRPRGSRRASRLLTILNVDASPARGPSTNKTPGDAAEDAAHARAGPPVSPDTIIVIVPAAAFAGPPDTGASRSAMPRKRRAAAPAPSHARIDRRRQREPRVRGVAAAADAVDPEQHRFHLRPHRRPAR